MKYRVLIADAEDAFRNKLAATLESTNEFELIASTAESRKAMQVASENPPDMLILDLLLPQYDGLTLIDTIPKCKVFVVTAFTSSYILSALSARGVCALLKKPCSIQCVIDAMLKALRQEQLPVEEKSPDLTKQISQTLHDVGVPANVKGYRYLREAVKLAVEDFGRINNLTEGIYAPIARLNNSTPKRVRIAISTAINIAWDRGDLDTLQCFFGYTVSNTKGKPTNSEFIALIADKLQLQLKSSKVSNF